jgi:hypothetical protein
MINQKEIEVINKLNLSNYYATRELSEKCYLCDSSDTYDVVSNENDTRIIIYFRPFDGKNRTLCRKHFFIIKKIDDIVSIFVKILFKKITSKRIR